MNKKNKPCIFTPADVEVVKQDVVYQGYFQIEKLILKHRLFAGGWTPLFEREIFERGHAAGALLYDPVLHKIILIEQFRVGTIGNTENPWLLEIVAGIIDKDETAEQVVKRETLEEANLEVQEVFPICDYWVSPGGTSEKVALFCVRVDSSKADGIHGLVEENEDIRVLVFDVEEVYDLLKKGKICNAATIIAVQWFQLNEKMIREKWIRNSR